MKEYWKDIPGYEGKYQASTTGKIRSLDRIVNGICHYTGKIFDRHIKGKVLRPGVIAKIGHLSVVLRKGCAGIPVHQLIFIDF